MAGEGEPIRVRHHFVPVFLLAGFTHDGSKGGTLQVFDLKTGAHREARPESVAFEKNLNTIEVPGMRPDAVEKLLNDEFESKAAPVIREICTSLVIPAGKNLRTFLRFMALQAGRVPHATRSWISGLDEMADLTLHIARSCEPLWTSAVVQLRGMGIDVLSTFNEIKSQPDAKPRWHNRKNEAVRFMLDSIKSEYGLLTRRFWTLVSIPNSVQAEFVCSDDPLSLFIPGGRPRGPWGYGFLTPGTELTLPLSKTVAVIGSLQRQYPSLIVADERIVAQINTRTLLGADRFLFGATSDFTWDCGERLGHFADVQRKRGKCSELNE